MRRSASTALVDVSFVGDRRRIEIRCRIAADDSSSVAAMGNRRRAMGLDPRRELSQSVHRKISGPSTSKIPQDAADLGVQLLFDSVNYPQAFTVVKLSPTGALAKTNELLAPHLRVARGDRIFSINGVNVLPLKRKKVSRMLGKAVAESKMAGSWLSLGFEQIRPVDDRLSRDPSTPSLWGKWSLKSRRPKSAGTFSVSNSLGKSSSRSLKSSSRSRASRVRPMSSLPSRYGGSGTRGGSFDREKRPWQKAVEMQHMATQAVPSCLNKQVKSTSRTSPSCSIGRSTREDWVSIGFNGIVKLKSSGGSSGQFSCLRSNRSPGFGVSERKLPPFRGIDKGLDSPGGIYNLKSTLGTKRTCSFGAGKRNTIATDTGLDSPGPVYEPKDLNALGRDPKKGVSFGHGPAHEVPMSEYGLDTPSPAYYTLRSRWRNKRTTNFGEPRSDGYKFYPGRSDDTPVNHEICQKQAIKTELATLLGPRRKNKYWFRL